MNSLQYLSSHVNSLIGTSVQEQDESEQAHQQASNDPLFGPLLGSKEESEVKESEAGSEIADSIESDLQSGGSKSSSRLASILYLPHQLASIVWSVIRTIVSIFIFPLRFVTSSRKPRVASLDNRRLQSPYSQEVRIPRVGARTLFPSRPLLRPGPVKTLVLDLDETLIHSLSRTSSFSQGQMVEIKLSPDQLATLYLVNKRPYCDQFLQAVSQWYNLVVFTASVQAYADPMIDWLERERKYFRRRFYRQHCTSTGSGYVKDLSKVDGDLSRIVIIDNSPVSYSMHDDNAISIEGWISDPSDHSLLHLIPLLNALRYTTDVRSLLSLKRGEALFESN